MKIDWMAAKSEYIANTDRSYRVIAQKYGVSETAVKERASKEKWRQLRVETLLIVDQRLPEKLGIKKAGIQAEQYVLGKLQIRNALLAQQDHISHDGENVAHVVHSQCSLCEQGNTGRLVLAKRPSNYMETLRSIERGIQNLRQSVGLDRPDIVPAATNSQQGSYASFYGLKENQK